MKRVKYLLLSLFPFAGCGQLEKLTWDMTPEKWLATHSYMSVKLGSLDFILAEPSSTIIVYGLGVVILIAGLWFLKNKGSSTSRLLWGIGLLLWSASTFSAGTSYQAFSYELKCAERTICLWTSWWEIWYLMLYVASMNVITAAVAYSSSVGKLRKIIVGYTIVNTVLYTATVLTGAFSPNQFLASFECMVLFSSPMFIILLAVNISRYIKKKISLEIKLVIAWLLMFVIVIAYFGFYMSGIADVLWQNGIWFNANDVLHVGLIFWIAYLYYAIAKKVEDAS